MHLTRWSAWLALRIAAILAASFACIASVGKSAGAHQYQLRTLHSFCISDTYCPDGKAPLSGVVMDDKGNLYGTTSNGGGGHYIGTVFELQFNPAKRKWSYELLYRFCAKKEPYCADGSAPASQLIVDVNGNLYGTTTTNGHVGGTVFELSPHPPHDAWKVRTLYKFCRNFSCEGGRTPLYGGLTYAGKDAGALYDGTSPLFGMTYNGGPAEAGVAFMLTANADKTHLVETVIHQFCVELPCTNGFHPEGGLIMDSAGDLYGTTTDIVGDRSAPGTIFELSPSSHKRWRYTILHRFCSQPNCGDGLNPTSTLLMDASGALYGTTMAGGLLGFGVAFKLSSTPSGWSETVMHNFCSIGDRCADGENPYGGMTMDASGNLFGTTWAGGSGLFGTIFTLKPQLQILYNFCSQPTCSDGEFPSYGSPTMDLSGALFGTTQGGGAHGGGTVFELMP